MVDPEKIRTLVEMMSEYELSEICWRSGEEEIQLRRPGHAPVPWVHPPQMSVPSATAVPQQQPAFATQGTPPVAPVAAGPGEPAAEAGMAALLVIESPMVGTYYAAPDPQSSPFVTVGSRVAPGTVVCIIEAMKVFNEIKAEVSGTVEKVLVKNGDPVEFGQLLFAVRPD